MHEAHGGHGNVGMAINGGPCTAANGGAAIMHGFQRQKPTMNGEERPSLEACDLIAGLEESWR